MAFKKNKRQNIVVSAFALLALSSGIFLLTPSSTHADTWGAVGSVVSAATGGDNFIVTGFKFLLLGIFTMVGWIASIAVTIFGWAVNPDYISGSGGLLNRASVYTMWQFIRDFFNLFFILTLLYTAFTIVFQVASNYKKTLLSIVLAALFVNFSFPITRVIIDVANVPMYYFVNQIAAQTGGEQNNWLGTVLSASQIKDVLIPGAGNGGTVTLSDTTVSQLIMAIVFLFIFSITLLILAVLFVVRVAGLLILLIFSSVGFAASVIPGLGKYSGMWWEKLWQYTFFGPAAMLMLFVATSFFKEISADNTRAQFLQAGISNSVPEQAGFISAMAMFTIPIIMLWMAIGLATSMSIMGAGAITGKGQKLLKDTGRWLGRKTYDNPVGRGFKKGASEGKFLGVNYGKTKLGQLATPGFWKEPGKGGTAVTGFIAGGREGAKTEVAKLHAQKVNKAVKENKENQVNRSILLGNLKSEDIVERQAAALTLAENGEIRFSDDLTMALKALADKDKNGNAVYDDAAADMVTKVIDKAKDGATAGLSSEAYASIAGNNDFYVKDKEGKVVEKDGKPVAGAALEALNSKLKKDGQINVRVNYDINQRIEKMEAAGPVSPEMKRQAQDKVYSESIGKMGAEDIAKQKDIYNEEAFKDYAVRNMSADKLRKIVEKAIEKSDDKSQAGWADIVARKGKGASGAGSSSIDTSQATGRGPRSHTTYP